MLKKLIIVCLINFLIAAIMGLLLRYSFINPINLNYRFLTHAHSHVAMLGWVYLILYAFIVHYFIADKKPIYTRLFWVTEIAVVGMMLSFPLQGYAAISISFSTLHILCSYIFVYLIWKHHDAKSLVTSYLLRASLLFMIISTIGVWCLGPAIGLHGKSSAFYQIAIQFFLHFQFNGWFLIATLAIFFHQLNIQDSKLFRLFFITLIVSTVFTLALPIQWFASHRILFWINAVGVIMVLIALISFLKLIKPNFHLIRKQDSTLLKILYCFTIFCLILKGLFQGLSILPEFSQVVFEHRNFVIGFIHLVMLGIITGFIFSFILKSNVVRYTKTLSIGIYSFIIGFALTELLLLVQGYRFYFGNAMIENYYEYMFYFSIFIPLGILIIVYCTIRNSRM